MSARLFSAISFSMVAHLVIWSGFLGQSPKVSDRSKASLLENSVFIDPAAMEAVRKAKAKAKAAAEAKVVQAPPAQKKVQQPAKPKAVEEKPAPPAPSAETLQEALVKAISASKRPEKSVRVTPVTTKAGLSKELPANATKTGADLMANPETRGLFADYFGQVKSRIQEKLREKCAGRQVGRGSVDLAFILLADGRLSKVYVVERRSATDSQLKQLAIESLHESAPFIDFPSDFNARQIAFNLTVFFDDL